MTVTFVDAERSLDPAALVTAHDALRGAIGTRLSIPECAPPTRMAGEYARDEAGRRLPAHLEPYRLQAPHSWWPGFTQIDMWGNPPKWSYRRR